MLKNSISKFFKHDLGTLLKNSWANVFGVSIFIWFLLFLLNIFLWVSLYANQFTGQLKDRLGMYFYIKEDTTQTNEIYKKVIALKDELESNWLKVMFSSKADALAFLQKKIPDVVSNFQKFGIENPLPATLYVMFDNDSKYESLKTIVLKNKDIILNTKDIDAGSTLKQQENRVLTIINLSNFVVGMSYIIIAILLCIIIAFLGFLLKNVFYTFHRELEVKKILWATYNQIMQGFVALTINVLGFSFLICLALLLVSWITINYYVYSLFNVTLWSIFSNILLVLGVFIGEIVVIAWMGFGFSYFFARALNKRL
ncbi:MAG: hypothetical protein ACD_80C00145G0001 [uncultured bacterium (gcode 4)]|uniref:Cell division protein FtsX n=1 Tax=uncultured bacterium (gcode 4) TaxID=1234023 RepID=K1XI92_9BACT|nr:MAG: hypothetical protein ACD_80C00145G0001 [uncultured bacterium (gcode 4)]